MLIFFFVLVCLVHFHNPCPFRRPVVPPQCSLPNPEATPEEWRLCVAACVCVCVCVCVREREREKREGERVCVCVWRGVYCPYWGQSNWQSKDGSRSGPTKHTHTHTHTCAYIESKSKRSCVVMCCAVTGSGLGTSNFKKLKMTVTGELQLHLWPPVSPPSPH